MNQLTLHMYRRAPFNKHHSEPSTLFGLREGQVRSPGVIPKGCWYNMNGERIGWGDLSSEDLMRISNEIDRDEIFFILYSLDAERIGYEPGINHVLSKAFMAITRNHIYYVAKDIHNVDQYKISLRYRVPMIEILKA